MKLDALISALSELSSKESITEADVAKAIQANADKVYHTIFRSGFKENETRAESSLTSARGEIETLTSKLEKASASLDELKKGTGDKAETAAVIERYERALQAKDEEIRTREKSLEEADSKFKQTIREREFTSFKERVRNRLVSDGVNPDFADAKVQLLPLERVELDENLQISRVLQPDGATPYPQSADAAPWDYIARELYEATPPALKEDRRQQGSRLGGGSQQAPRFSERDISKMSDAEYSKNREEIFRAQAEGRIVR